MAVDIDELIKLELIKLDEVSAVVGSGVVSSTVVVGGGGGAVEVVVHT